MEQFRQRIVASCHLAPLTDIECQAYIEYRMQHAGWDGRALFSADAYDRIFQFTYGIPRKINTLMDRILLFGFLEELETLDLEAVENVIKEVSEEMFEPEKDAQVETQAKKPVGILDVPTEHGQVKDVDYYKTMITELVDALDNAISQKIKLTRYIDRLLQKKYKTYMRLKSDD
jgi:hypothetical protein